MVQVFHAGLPLFALVSLFTAKDSQAMDDVKKKKKVATAAAANDVCSGAAAYFFFFHHQDSTRLRRYITVQYTSTFPLQ